MFQNCKGKRRKGSELLNHKVFFSIVCFTEGSGESPFSFNLQLKLIIKKHQ